MRVVSRAKIREDFPMRAKHLLFVTVALLGGARATPTEAAPPSGCGIVPNSVYVGRYFCAQGWTDMTLTVVDVEGPRVQMRGDFAHAGTGVRGSYLLRGSCFPRTQRMVLIPQGWVQQPPGYIMVGLSGTVMASGQGFTGRMLHRSCGEFTFNRQ